MAKKVSTKVFDVATIGEMLFEGVSCGKITMSEYKNAVAAVKTIKKVLG